MKVGIDYPGVSIVFFCKDRYGNFLMNKRSENCRDEKGRWDIGAGALKIHEKIEEALEREIKEEYGTSIINYEFLGYRDVHRKDNQKRTHWVALDFKVLVDSNIVKNGEPDKFDEIGWFRLDNIPFPVHSQLPHFLEIYKNKL